MAENKGKLLLDKLVELKSTCLNYLYITFDMLKSSPRSLYYIVAVAIGLGLARVVDAGALAYISLAGQEKKPQREAVRSHPRSLILSNDTNPLDIVGGALFSMAPVEEEIEEEEEEKEPPIDYTVLGTIDGHPSFASVVVKLLGGDLKGRSREYYIGSTIGADLITWIGREYIVIRRGGRGGQRVKIEVGQNAFVAIEEILKKVTAENAAKDTKDSINKTVSKQDVTQILNGNPAEIYKDASFGPVIEKGNITGYKIFRVKSSHFFYKLGARGGDIIRKVNGFELNDTERMFELWKSMKTASNVSIDLERGGKLVKYNLNIVN